MLKASKGAVVVAAALVAVFAGAPARAAEKLDPPLGIDPAAKKGFSIELQGGVFTAFGGSRMASNAQPFTGVSIGFDLPQLAPGLGLFFTAAHGANAGACRDFTAKNGANVCATWDDPPGVDRKAPEDFSVVPLELGARYAFMEILPRFTANATLALGYTLLSPAITETAGPGTPHVGVGGGVEYATRLEGLSVGAELLVRVGFTPLYPSFTAYPRIRYTF